MQQTSSKPSLRHVLRVAAPLVLAAVLAGAALGGSGGGGADTGAGDSGGTGHLGSGGCTAAACRHRTPAEQHAADAAQVEADLAEQARVRACAVVVCTVSDDGYVTYIDGRLVPFDEFSSRELDHPAYIARRVAQAHAEADADPMAR